MEKVAYSAEFARYGLLGHDAVYCGTDLPTFRWNLIASFSLIKVSHPRCVIKIQVREGYPICVQSQNTTKHKTKFITLLQQHVSA